MRNVLGLVAKNCTTTKAFHRTSFPDEGLRTYFEKTVTQNKPVFARRKTTKGFARKNCTLTKPFRGASFRRLGCSAFRAEIHTEHCALRRSHICAKLPHRGGIRTLEHRRFIRLYSCIVSYKAAVVNRNINICLCFVINFL